MSAVLSTVWDGISNALLMAWAVWWALVLGFAISAIVQAWVPMESIQAGLGGSRGRPVALATGLGAASSSCSYAAIAIARSLFAKGASAASALAFQFASTNLVVELGIVIWVLIGWQFTLAELVGGVILIVTMTMLLRLFISREREDRARVHAQRADSAHQHHAAGTRLTLRERLCIGFGGVIAFLFADLIVLPIVLIYRRYYGLAFAARVTALMFVTIVLAALMVAALFSAAGLVPHIRPSRADIFGPVAVDYTLFANLVGVAVFAGLFGLTMRGGAVRPACGMGA